MNKKTNHNWLLIGAAGVLIAIVAVNIIFALADRSNSNDEAISSSSEQVTEQSSSSSYDFSSLEKLAALAINIKGIEDVAEVSSTDEAEIAQAIQSLRGDDAEGELNLEVIDRGDLGDEDEKIVDVVFSVADTNSDARYNVFHTNTGWHAVPIVDNTISAIPEAQAAEDATIDLSSQDQWSDVANFNNELFNIDEAISLADEEGISGLLSEPAVEAIASGVQQYLSESGLEYSSPASLFVEKTSIEDKDGNTQCKILAHHTGGSSVFLATYDPAQDGVYLDLFTNDLVSDADE